VRELLVRVVVQFLVPEAGIEGGRAVDVAETGTRADEAAVKDPPDG
jgi:hypothetical protein